MSRRGIRKLTTWSTAEWSHVAAEANAAGVPALRFVREAALGARSVTVPFQTSPTGGGVWASCAPEKAADEVVVGLARMLGSLRRLDSCAVEGSHTKELLASASVAVERALDRATASTEPASPLVWMVLPYAEAAAGFERLAAASGSFPPDFALHPLLATILAWAG